MINVLIGIQARCTSTRLPSKVLEKIGGKTEIGHVLDAAFNCASYFNRHSNRDGVSVHTALLVPTGDELVGLYQNKTAVVEGPEDDVLTRYVAAQKQFSADYIVRLTGDCPLLPPFMITKHINVILKNGYDYVQDVEEGLRGTPDGYDVEIMNAKALEWLETNAKTRDEREHVTIKLRKSPPSWLSVGFVLPNLDLSGIKISVDTEEDLTRVRDYQHALETKYSAAVRKYGKKNVHRY